MAAFLQCRSRQPGPTLTVAIGGSPSEMVLWQNLIADFERRTSVRIDFNRQPSDTDLRRQGLVAALRSQSSKPDVFLLDVAWLAQFASSGWLESLDSHINSSSVQTQVFFENIIQIARPGGKLVALPVFIDGGILYYRKDLLDEAGFQPPRTWQDLLRQSQVIQQSQRSRNPGFYGFVWQGAQYEGLICNWIEFLGKGPERGVMISQSGITVDTPDNEEATAFMRELIARYQISPPNTYTEMREEQCRMYFQQGNALFERNWPFAWTLHEANDSPVRGRIAISAIPHWPGCESVSAMGGWLAGISKFSSKKDKAFEFCAFLCSYETQKKLALKMGLNPARTDVYDDVEVIRDRPYFRELRTIFADLQPRPDLPYYTLVSEILQRNINSALAGRKSADQALKTAQQEISQLVSRYGKE
jgi:multiple sugar transport system substrate-binding protein